jgi:CheY-like chemotaxis protein
MAGDRKKIIVVDNNPENPNAFNNTTNENYMVYSNFSAPDMIKLLENVRPDLILMDKESYIVYPNISAQDMFELLEQIRPDLILLNVEMPGMNGDEVIKKLESNAKYRKIPVIFLSSMNDTQSEEEVLQLDAVDYIQKPLVAPILLERIKTHPSILN